MFPSAPSSQLNLPNPNQYAGMRWLHIFPKASGSGTGCLNPTRMPKVSIEHITPKHSATGKDGTDLPRNSVSAASVQVVNARKPVASCQTNHTVCRPFFAFQVWKINSAVWRAQFRQSFEQINHSPSKDGCRVHACA